MSRVLLPASNHSRWARTVADVLAETEPDDTTAVVMHVFDDVEVESTRKNLDLEGRPSIDSLARRKSGVSAALKRLTAEGYDCEVRGVEYDDDPADAIVDQADQEGVDRIYMFSRRRSPAGKAVFGSTLQQVILEANVPVVVTPANLT